MCVLEWIACTCGCSFRKWIAGTCVASGLPVHVLRPLRSDMDPTENAVTTIIDVILSTHNDANTRFAPGKGDLTSCLAYFRLLMAPTVDKLLTCKSVSLFKRFFLHSQVDARLTRFCRLTWFSGLMAVSQSVQSRSCRVSE